MYRLAQGGTATRCPRAEAPSRVTIRDIAERAGVSKGAVSYALNGRPGVSDDTRVRILSIADELGWYPNRAARALSAARADACGLVLARPARTLALEPFFMEFIAGVESELVVALDRADPAARARTSSEEIEVYRRWWGEHRVDGVLVVDLRVDDPARRRARPPRPPGGRRRWTAPGSRSTSGIRTTRRPSSWKPSSTSRRSATRASRTSPASATSSTRAQRTEAFRACDDATSGSRPTSSRPTTAPSSGARATRRLLSAPDPPTAIVFDSDLLAVTGLGVAQHMGFSVPDDLSIVGWDDSLISQVVHPPLTAITRDITGLRRHRCRHLLAAIDGRGDRGRRRPSAGELTTRGSTGRARRVRRPAPERPELFYPVDT